MKVIIDHEGIVALKEIIEGVEDEPEFVRLFLSGRACSGPSFGISLDQSSVNDLTYEQEGLTFIMDKDLYTQYGDIVIKTWGAGFMVYPESNPPMSCGTCGGCA